MAREMTLADHATGDEGHRAAKTILTPHES